MSDTMLERVARAIGKADKWDRAANSPDHRSHLPAWHEYADLARAAIEAMREPTEAMSAALDDQLSLWVQEIGSNEDVYYAAIDAALQPATDSEASK